MPSGRSNSALKKVLIVSSLPALLAASFFYHPYSRTGPVMCVIKMTMGMPCMGCGLTRAIGSLTRLEVGEAVRFHLLSPVILPTLGLWWAFAIRRAFRGASDPRWWSPVVKVVLYAMFLLWAGRMVMFLSHPKGWLSLLTKNFVVRIVRLDPSNTWEPRG